MIPPWFDEYSSLKLSAELPKTPQPAREAQRSFQQPECAAFKIWESQRDGNVRKEATLASGLGCWILMTRIAKKRYHYSFRNLQISSGQQIADLEKQGKEPWCR